MLDYIRGTVAELTPTTAVLDNQGIGYALSISLNTYTALNNQKEARLYVYEALREDAHLLYGFATKQERELFLLLITVPGIGGSTARVILSTFSPAELVQVISAGEEKILKTVKGIGLKTAQRIIVDLKDKVDKTSAEAGIPTLPGTDHAAVYDEAVSALTMLGFAAAPSQKVVRNLLKERPDAGVEQIIKLALKHL